MCLSPAVTSVEPYSLYLCYFSYLNYVFQIFLWNWLTVCWVFFKIVVFGLLYKKENIILVLSFTSSQKFSKWELIHRVYEQLLFCCYLVAKWNSTLSSPMDCSMPGFPVLHYILESTQPHVHWVSDAIQSSLLLLPLLLLSSNLCNVICQLYHNKAWGKRIL